MDQIICVSTAIFAITSDPGWPSVTITVCFVGDYEVRTMIYQKIDNGFQCYKCTIYHLQMKGFPG